MKKVYISKHREYIATIKSPKMQMINGQNIQVDEGLTIKFSNGYFATEDQTVIDLLERASGFGSDFLDVNKQHVAAKEAEAKLKTSAVSVIEGAIGQKAVKPEEAANKPTTLEETNEPVVAEVFNSPVKTTPKRRGRPRK